MPPAAPMPDIRSRAPPAAGTRGQSATLSSSSHQTAGSTGTPGAAITRLEAIGIKSCCRSSQLAARLTAGHLLPHSRVQQSIAPLRTCLGDGEAQLGGQLPQQQVVGQALAHKSWNHVREEEAVELLVVGVGSWVTWEQENSWSDQSSRCGSCLWPLWRG